MIQEIMRDTDFLAQKAEPATPKDLQVGSDLLDHITSCFALRPLGQKDARWGKRLVSAYHCKL